MSERFSPDWLSEKIMVRWSKQRSILAQKIEISPYLNALGAIILFCIGVATLRFWTPPPEEWLMKHSPMLLFVTRCLFRTPILLGWLAVFASLTLIWPKKEKIFASFAAIVSVAHLAIAADIINQSAIMAAISWGTTTIIPIMGFLLFLAWPNRWGFAIMIASGPLGFLAANMLAHLGPPQPGKFLAHNSRYYMVLWFLASEIIAQNGKRLFLRENFIGYLLSPAQLINPVNVSSAVFKRSKSHWNSILLGIELVIISSAYALIAVYVIPKEPNTLISLAVTNYLKYFFLSYASMSFAEAGFRISGYELGAVFRVPLLAPDPGKRWQRWSVPFYEFLRGLVFTPIVRRFGKPFLAILITFWASALIHELPYYFLQGEDSNIVISGRRTFLTFLFFSLHGIAVYLALKFPRLWPSGSTLKGWIGVVITFILMAGIHVFAP